MGITRVCKIEYNSNTFLIYRDRVLITNYVLKCLATWNTVNYNCGGAFNGVSFKATCHGIYSFYVTVYQASTSYGYVYLYQGSCIAQSQRSGYEGRKGSIVVQATLKLTKGMQICAGFGGSGLSEAGFQTTITHFFNLTVIARIMRQFENLQSSMIQQRLILKEDWSQSYTISKKQKLQY